MTLFKRLNLIAPFVLAFTLLVSGGLRAEQMEKLGPWNVHYIAFGSTFLTPQIAKSYGLERSNSIGVVNISVLNDGKGYVAQKVDISGTATNLLGNVVELEFKQIAEGQSIYYIAQIDYSNEETFRFEVNIKQGDQAQVLKFSQQFYTH